MRALRVILVVATASFACKSEIPVATCPSGTANTDGICRVQCTSEDQCLWDEACAGNVCLPRDAAEGPKVRLFRPDRVLVTPREPQVHFDYVVTNAATVEVTPAPGLLASHAGTFSADLTEETTFTIRAVGADGAEVTASETISFTDDPLPGQLGVELRVERAEVRPCDGVDVQWTVVGGAGRIVEVWLEVDGTEVLRRQDASGHARIDLGQPASLKLYAEAGADLSGTSQVVQAAPGLICRVAAEPGDEVPLGDTVLLSFETRGAQTIEVRDTGTDDVVWRRPGAPASEGVVSGSALVLPSRAETDYAVVAIAPDDRMDHTPIRIRTTGEAPAPPIYRFDAAPPYFMDTAAVSVSWDTRLATELTLEIEGSSLPLSGGSGTRQVTLEKTSDLWLHVRRGSAESNARTMVWSVLDEMEPNDLQSAANEIADVARVGSIGGAEVDVADWFETSALHGVLRVRVVAPLAQGCGVLDGLSLSVVGPKGDTLTGFPRAIGPDCVDITLTGLIRGPYFLVVQQENAGDLTSYTYLVATDVAATICGDRIADPSEACDDGNTRNGDGCNQDCALEPGFSYDVDTGQISLEQRPPDAEELRLLAPLGNGGTAAEEGFEVIPADVQFFGRRYAGIVVSVNGYVTFLPQLAETSQIVVGDPDPPNAMIAAAAGDLRLEGTIAWWSREVPRRHWVIDFDRVTVVGGSGSSSPSFGFRINVFADGEVSVTYNDVDTVLDHPIAVGVEDATGRYFRRAMGCEPSCSGMNLPNRLIYTPR